MKIDIPVHTKKVKQGDSPLREITPERFSEIVLSTDVKILAITNHNIFDIQQCDQISEQVDGAIQVWPGIELDVVQGGRRSHLIVIVSPNQKVAFSNAVKKATEGFNLDEFAITLEDTVAFFDGFDPIYVAHYLTAVSSGEEALSYIKDYEFDLVVLDMIMDPGIDGLDTYRKILKIKPGQKAIIASGFSETSRVKEAQSLGVGAYVQKPYTLLKLGNTVKKELEKGGKRSISGLHN